MTFRRMILGLLALILPLVALIVSAAVASKEGRGSERFPQQDLIPEPATVEENAGGAPAREAIPEEPNLTFRDILTGDELDLPDLRLESATGAILFQGRSRNFSRTAIPAEAGAFWVYAVATVEGTVDNRVKLEDAMPSELGVVELPFHACIEGVVVDSVAGGPLEGVEVSAWVIRSAELQATAREIKAFGDLPEASREALAILMTRGTAKPIGQMKQWKSRTDQLGWFSLAIPVSGELFLHYWKPPMVSATGKVLAVAGQWIRADRGLAQRPVLRGRVFGPSGVPLPGQRVKLGVGFKLPAADLSPHDLDNGFGTILATSPGQVLFHTKTATITGEDGTFEQVVPQGVQYSASAGTDDGFGFAFVENFVPALDNEIRLDVHVLVPDAASPKIQFFFPDGNPVANASVTVMIVDDPWTRQFPTLRTDAAGQVQIPWVDQGVRFGVVLRSKEIEKSARATLIGGGQDVVVLDAVRIPQVSNEKP